MSHKVKYIRLSEEQLDLIHNLIDYKMLTMKIETEAQWKIAIELIELADHLESSGVLLESGQAK